MLVSNTSTLVLLAKIGCLEEFIQISPPIEIPEQVEKEALFKSESYYAKLIQKLITINKMRIIKMNNEKTKYIMSEFRIGEGEAATYLAFNKNKHKAILTDDGELIKLCKLEKIPFLCAMAIVIRLHENKIISKETAIKKLEELNEIGRYSEELYEHFKMEIK